MISAACRTLLAVSLAAPAAGAAGANEPLYVLDGEAIFRVVPGSADVKVADDIGPGVPTALRAPVPDYPADLDRAWVLEVEAIIAQDGTIEKASIIGSRPFPDPPPRWTAPAWVPELQAAAVEAFEAREYRPVVLNGEAIRLRIAVALVYNPSVPAALPRGEGADREDAAPAGEDPARRRGGPED